jgi:hypothetical protein
MRLRRCPADDWVVGSSMSIVPDVRGRWPVVRECGIAGKIEGFDLDTVLNPVLRHSCRRILHEF